MNEYFGWYRSVIENLPDQPATTTADLSAYLDAAPRREPGPPARDHRVRRGGHALRARSDAEGHLRVPAQVRARTTSAIHGSKPYVNGSIYWALRDFRVHQTWQRRRARRVRHAARGTTRACIEETNRRKPAFLDVARALPAHEAAPLACAAREAPPPRPAARAARARRLRLERRRARRSTSRTCPAAALACLDAKGIAAHARGRGRERGRARGGPADPLLPHRRRGRGRASSRARARAPSRSAARCCSSIPRSTRRPRTSSRTSRAA